MLRRVCPSQTPLDPRLQLCGVLFLSLIPLLFRPFFSTTSNLLFPQVLSFDIHTKTTRGVGGPGANPSRVLCVPGAFAGRKLCSDSSLQPPASLALLALSSEGRNEGSFEPPDYLEPCLPARAGLPQATLLATGKAACRRLGRKVTS
jgi:hypothetical protein